MNYPLLIPHCRQRSGCDFCDCSGDAWRAESSETILVPRAQIRIAWIERHTQSATGHRIARIGWLQHNEHRVEIRLVQHVDVDPLRDIPPVTDVPSRGIELSAPAWGGSALDGQPILVLRQAIDARQIGAHPLLDQLHTGLNWPQQGLAD